LPNGGEFVGWGQQPYFTEYDAKGHVLYDGRFLAATPNYRAYRMLWSAQPVSRPALAAGKPAHRATPLYASWNGATAVASWQILSGSSATSLAPRGKPVARKAFETGLLVHTSGPYFAVQALSASGVVLGQSVAVKAG